jgi:hypothetical protein
VLNRAFDLGTAHGYCPSDLAGDFDLGAVGVTVSAHKVHSSCSHVLFAVLVELCTEISKIVGQSGDLQVRQVRVQISRLVPVGGEAVSTTACTSAVPSCVPTRELCSREGRATHPCRSSS